MHLTIYSKPGCHLCDEMKAVVTRVAAGRPDISIDEIDVSRDPHLADQYGLEIPVLMIDGRKAAKYRVSADGLKRMLDADKRKG